MCNQKSFSGFTIYTVEGKEERGREGEGRRSREQEEHGARAGGRNRWHFRDNSHQPSLIQAKIDGMKRLPLKQGEPSTNVIAFHCKYYSN